MEQSQLKSVLESLLFVSSKPVTARALAAFLEQDEEQIRQALGELKQERGQAGIVLLENNGEYELASSPANSTQVKNYLNAELREKLTDATVEVLAIIAYRQPISKAEIEAIRGVNSQYSIRNLLMRGLVEKIPNPNDARSVLYRTTTEFLMHLGLSSVGDLPDFNALTEKIKLPETPQSQEAASVASDPKPAAGQEIPPPPAAAPGEAAPNHTPEKDEKENET